MTSCEKMAKRKTLLFSEKYDIFRSQNHKCNNEPGSNLYNIGNYLCPFWKHYDGYIDESGFVIDHVAEYSSSKDDTKDNLQALCSSCHAVKTRNCMKEKGNLFEE